MESKSKSFVEKIVHNSIIQAFVIFISSGWIILEITEYFIENFGLNENARNILLIVLLCIFPIVILYAWFLYKKQKDTKKELPKDPVPITTLLPRGRFKRFLFSFRKPQFLFPAILIIVAIVISLIFRSQHQSKIRYAIDYSIPSLQNEFEQLINNPYGERNWSIYKKASVVRDILDDNPDLDKLWYNLTVPLTITTNPPDAIVYAKPYSKPDTSWNLIGTTPIEGFPFPRGLSRIKIEKAELKTQFDVIGKPFGWQDEADTLHYQLFKESEVPDGMVHITRRAGDQKRFMVPDYLGNFWMDCYEVTNREYKIFLDAGGYTNPSYWEFPFIVEDDTISFDDAKKKFIDNTGWTGPANWELGEFPKGSGNLPVTGVSWYEALAYAKFIGKSLPTIFHWSYVSESNAAPEIIKFSNFNKKGPVEKGTYNSMTRFGTYDLPGNVSEWIYNSTGNDRYFLGGNFREPPYMYNLKSQISPWIRNELIGFRCIKYIDDALEHKLIQNFDQQKRDYTNLQPVSEEIFQVYKELLEFERIELNPSMISKTFTKDWVKEIISVDVPYEDVPMNILILLPVNYKPPYQAIVYFPGLDAHYSNAMANMKIHSGIDFFLKSGRAIIWPVYYSSHGRGRINIQNLNEWKQSYKNIIIDVQITIDYVQTRNDIDPDRIAYY